MHLDIASSRIMGGWVILVHALPILLLRALPTSGWLSLAVIAALFVSLVRSWRLQVSRHHQDAVCSMVWGEGRDCLLGLHSDGQEEVSMCAQALVLPWLVILHFNSRQRRKKYLVLLPDMVDREAFRKLRVRLKLEINRS